LTTSGFHGILLPPQVRVAARKAGSMWYPAEQPSPRATSLREFLGRSTMHEATPAPVDRRLTVLAWTGTLLLAASLAFLALAPRHLDPTGRHAQVLLVGRGVFAAVLRAGGRAGVVLPAGLAALAAAAVLAVWTSGFRRARRWQQYALLGVGLLGVAAVAPVALALAVAALNLAIWLGLAMLAVAAVRGVIVAGFDA
jgi:hypothetical protein